MKAENMAEMVKIKSFESVIDSISGVQHALEMMVMHDDCDMSLVRVLANELDRCYCELCELQADLVELSESE